MSHTQLRLFLLIATLIGFTAASAQTWSPPTPEQRCPSKWGAEDERGAANLMGPEAVLRATKLIRQGKVFELGKELNNTIPFFGERRFSMQLKRTTNPAATNKQRSNEEIGRASCRERVLQVV